MKKKILAIVLAVCLVSVIATLFGAMSFAAAAEPNLDKDEDGFYKISTYNDLVEFKDNYVERYEGRLYGDIDATGKAWTPWTKDQKLLHIDGNNHSITGLSYTFEDKDGQDWTTVGLFTSLLANDNFNSWIRNLTFKKCTLTVTITDNNENSRFGIATAHIDRGAVENVNYEDCKINVTGNGKGYYVGFAAGWSEWNYGDDGVIVSGNVTKGSITAKGNWARVGGLVGCHHSDTLILEKSTVDFTAETDGENVTVAPYVAEIHDEANTVVFGDKLVNNTTYKNEVPRYDRATVTVTTADQLIDMVSKINDGTYGWKDQDGVTIRSKTGIRLGADIDLTGKTWTPIQVLYVGLFDGNNKTIRGIQLTYNDVTSGHYGMIANDLTNGGGNGRIRDLTLANCSLTVNAKAGAELGEVYVGGFAGQQNRGLVLRDHLVGCKITVNGNFTGHSAVGGLLGEAEWDYDNGVSVEECDVDDKCVIEANGEEVVVAGLLGAHRYNDRLDVNKCECAATVRGNYIAAGLVGIGFNAGDGDHAIYNSTFTGVVVGSKAAGAYGDSDGSKMKLQNTKISGRVSGSEAQEALSFFANLELLEDSNGDDVVFFKELGETNDKGFGALLQTLPGNGSQSVRVLMVADWATMKAMSGITVKVVFTLTDGTVKTYTGVCNGQKSDLALYRNITAGNDLYAAKEGDVIFGAAFTGVPTNLSKVVITITQDGGTELYSGTHNFTE